MSITEIRSEADAYKRKFEQEWGGFRRWLAKHPLTGFWLGFSGALVVGYLAGKVF